MKSDNTLQEMTFKDVRVRWPRVTAHVIAESLGYATPDCAASIIRDALLGESNYCEWVATCYQGDARRVLENSIRNRRYHKATWPSIGLPYKLFGVRTRQARGRCSRVGFEPHLVLLPISAEQTSRS